MGDNTNIEWTDATWNPIVGCSLVSPGCTNCYAMKVAARLAAISSTKHYLGTVETVKGRPIWTGLVNAAPDAIWYRPIKWQRPRRIFVNSMGDLFHEAIPDVWVGRAFVIMALAPNHTFQVLTKRAERMRQYMRQQEIGRRIYKLADALACVLNLSTDHPSDRYLRVGENSAPWPLPNVWLGVSAEDQPRADQRIPVLLETPAVVRFVSAEPLLGPINLRRLSFAGGSRDALYVDREAGFRPIDAPLDWVIVGGESGADARPCDPEWVRSLRDQCAAADVAFFMKQWGEWTPREWGKDIRLSSKTESSRIGYWENGRFVAGGSASHLQNMGRVGKKSAGRVLDGRTHDEYPR